MGLEIDRRNFILVRRVGFDRTSLVSIEVYLLNLPLQLLNLEHEIIADRSTHTCLIAADTWCLRSQIGGKSNTIKATRKKSMSEERFDRLEALITNLGDRVGTLTATLAISKSE
jgi:hypothetical protein